MQLCLILSEKQTKIKFAVNDKQLKIILSHYERRLSPFFSFGVAMISLYNCGLEVCNFGWFGLVFGVTGPHV